MFATLSPCVCVVVARVCFVDALSELPTKTHKGNAQKRKQPNTYTDPDRTQHRTTHPDHAHVKHHHTPKPNQSTKTNSKGL